MPFFARTSWPGDHRDEVVAGALVAAVVVVLGYASGVGRSTAGGEVFSSPAPSNSTVVTSPAATGPASAPADGTPPNGGPVIDGGEPPSPGTPGGSTSPGPGPTGTSSPASPTGGPGPSAPPPSTPGSPAPTVPSPCDDGQVHLLQPVAGAALNTVTGVLDGLLGIGSSPSPLPTPALSPSAPSQSTAGLGDLLDNVCVPLATPSAARP